MLAEKVDLNVEAVQELPSAYCGIINPKKNDYNKVVISRVEEIIKLKGETWKNIEKEIGVEKLWNKVHKNPKKTIMQKIAYYLGCNVGYFYGMDIDPFYKDKPINNKNLLIQTLKDVKDEKVTRKKACEILDVDISSLGYLLIEYGYSKDDTYTMLKNDKIDVNEFIKICEDINNNKASISITAKLFNIPLRKCTAYYKAYNNGVLNKITPKEDKVVIKTVKPATKYNQLTVDVLRLYNKNIISGVDAARLLNIYQSKFSIISTEFGYTDIIKNFKSSRKYKSANCFIKSLAAVSNGNMKRKELLSMYNIAGNSADRYIAAFKNGVFKEYDKTGKIIQINPLTMEVDNFTDDDLNCDILKEVESEENNKIDKVLLHKVLKKYYNKEIEIHECVNQLKISTSTFQDLTIQYGYAPINIIKSIKKLGFEYFDDFIEILDSVHNNKITLKEAMLRCNCPYRTFINHLKAYENGVFDGVCDINVYYIYHDLIHQINPVTLEIDDFIDFDCDHSNDGKMEVNNMSYAINNEDFTAVDNNAHGNEIITQKAENNIDKSNNDFEDPSEIIKGVIDTLQKYNSCFNNSIESRINKLEGADKERAAFLIDSVLKSFNV